MVQNSGEDNHLVPLKNIGNVKNYSSKIRAFVATRDKYQRALANVKGTSIKF